MATLHPWWRGVFSGTGCLWPSSMEKVPELGEVEKFRFPPKKFEDKVANLKCHLPRHDIFYSTVIFFPIPTLNLSGDDSDLVGPENII